MIFGSLLLKGTPKINVTCELVGTMAPQAPEPLNQNLNFNKTLTSDLSAHLSWRSSALNHYDDCCFWLMAFLSNLSPGILKSSISIVLVTCDYA